MGSCLANLGCLSIEKEWSGCLYLRSLCTLCESHDVFQGVCGAPLYMIPAEEEE